MTTKTEQAMGLTYGDNYGADAWNTWMDSNLVKIGACAQISVTNMTQTAPPVTFTEGERFIVGAGATGTFAGHDGKLAVGVEGSYQFYTVLKGWLINDESTDTVKKWNGTSYVSIGTGTGTGLTWVAVKTITVGTGGDYADINAAMADIGVKYTGTILGITLLSNMTAASTTAVVFPNYVFVEINLNGFTVGTNISSIVGGSHYLALSGTGTFNNSGLQIKNWIPSIIGTNPTITVSAPIEIHDCTPDHPIFTGSSTLTFQGICNFNAITTGCQIITFSGSTQLGAVTANFVANPSQLFVVDNGSTLRVASVNITGASITTIYNLTQGIIFAGAVTGTYTNINNTPAATAGAIYGP